MTNPIQLPVIAERVILERLRQAARKHYGDKSDKFDQIYYLGAFNAVLGLAYDLDILRVKINAAVERGKKDAEL